MNHNILHNILDKLVKKYTEGIYVLTIIEGEEYENFNLIYQGVSDIHNIRNLVFTQLCNIIHEKFPGENVIFCKKNFFLPSDDLNEWEYNMDQFFDFHRGYGNFSFYRIFISTQNLIMNNI